MSNMSPNNLLEAPDNRVPAAPVFCNNRYFETREPWTVSYEGGWPPGPWSGAGFQ